MNFPTLEFEPPYLDKKQMKEVDRLMVEDYHIELLQMMENAGRNLARLAVNLFTKSTSETIAILIGSGGNGGGAMVSARWLHNWGYKTTIFLSQPENVYKNVPAHQLLILQKLGIPISEFEQQSSKEGFALIIDGIIGYSLFGPPTRTAGAMIEWANNQQAPILSLDLPSGLDATEGLISQTVIHATATMTLALPKVGLLRSEARPYIGDLYLADIGIPPNLYKKCGINISETSMFVENEIVRLW